ncbi:hypothetical protein B0H14DRAFT_2615325 [Mycena olivaceomarginata]|nr:hypothetical protein B0H14DRAFT_2615325 [Mycena olivaceomarginata]
MAPRPTWSMSAEVGRGWPRRLNRVGGGVVGRGRLRLAEVGRGCLGHVGRAPISAPVPPASLAQSAGLPTAHKWIGLCYVTNSRAKGLAEAALNVVIFLVGARMKAKKNPGEATRSSGCSDLGEFKQCAATDWQLSFFDTE